MRTSSSNSSRDSPAKPVRDLLPAQVDRSQTPTARACSFSPRPSKQETWPAGPMPYQHADRCNIAPFGRRHLPDDQVFALAARRIPPTQAPMPSRAGTLSSRCPRQSAPKRKESEMGARSRPTQRNMGRPSLLTG